MDDCTCTLTNDANTRIHARHCPNTPMPSRTLDGYEITDGMRVWDYDLDRGTVDLSRREQEYADGDVWFDVLKDGRTRPTMFNGSRVWKLHPTTRKGA